MFSKRRTVTFSALICACAIFALVPAGASATGTTAYSCSPSGGAKGFSDAHCNNAVTPGTGNFGHVLIEGTQEFTISNANTAAETTASSPISLFGTIAGVQFEAVCNTAVGEGKITNSAEGETMRATGTITTLEFSACTVPKPASGKCSVAEPIKYKGEFKTFQGETKMGVEFLPNKGENFGKFTIKDRGAEHCLLDGTYEIEGSFEGTPGSTPLGHGGTLGFSEEMCNLKWSGVKYTLAGSVTTKTKSGNAISFTT